MIRLGGITLSDDIVWENEFDNPVIAQQVVQTILGNTVEMSTPINGGREIVLAAVAEANAAMGVLTRAEVTTLKAMEASGQTFLLEYEGQNINVRFKAGGVQVRPHLARQNHEATDTYSGTIILIEV